LEVKVGRYFCEAKAKTTASADTLQYEQPWHKLGSKRKMQLECSEQEERKVLGR
jgi:hypothetical protein